MENIAKWLQEKRKEEGLSVIKVAAKTGLNRVTIYDIINGQHPSFETVKKIANAFGGAVLEDYLLELSGYRIRQDWLTAPIAKLLNRIRPFNDAELELMLSFADFVSKINK